jgi:hypothetical protein
MQEMSPQDLNFVLSRCPKDIRDLLKNNAGKLFLAGGFIRSTICGEKVSDIDLFGITRESLLAIAKDLTLFRNGRFFETKNAITVLSPPRFPVQFITRWLFSDAGTLIASFDFTVCQAVIWAEEKLVDAGETGEIKDKLYHFRSMVSDGFYPDLAAKRLVYTSPVREEEAGGSMVRAIKFIKKGYNIQAPSLAGVITRIVQRVDFNKVETEKEIAMIVTGLLREVDPLVVVDGVDFLDEHDVQEK